MIRDRIWDRVQGLGQGPGSGTGSGVRDGRPNLFWCSLDMYSYATTSRAGAAAWPASGVSMRAPHYLFCCAPCPRHVCGVS